MKLILVALLLACSVAGCASNPSRGAIEGAEIGAKMGQRIK